MTGLITRYVREFRDDPMTDPTMMYVNYQDWVNILASTNDQSGRHLFLWDESFHDSYCGEFTVDVKSFDSRTFTLRSIALGSDLWKSVAEKFEILNPSNDQFYHVRPIIIGQTMTEYRVIGINDDGIVQFEPVGTLECKV